MKIAIIGSGPAGFYTAEALLKTFEAAEIDLIECLPTPFGLVRYGVAPDHQSIKNVAKAFEKTALRPGVRFFGNVAVGKDASIRELLDLYDAVVLATGAPKDRRMGIPGEDLANVVGSAAFVGWYNCHPDHVDLMLDLDVEAVAVIGVGNVALDVARLLAKNAEELARSDIAPQAADALARSSIRDIYVIGRRGPLEATFTPQELKEFGELQDAEVLVDPAQLPETAECVPDEERTAKKKNLAILQDYAKTRGNGDGRQKRVHFLFYRRPAEILGDEMVNAITLERTTVDDSGKVSGTGEMITLDCGLVVPCIGYKTTPLPDVPFDAEDGHFKTKEGRIERGLFAAGWARRGPTGTIATNRADGQAVARQIEESCTPNPEKRGRAGLEKLLQARNVEIISFTDWQLIDEAERAAAEGPAPRRKFTSVDEMIHAAHGEEEEEK